MLAVSLAHRSCVCLGKHLWLERFHMEFRSGVKNCRIGAAFKVYGHELDRIHSRTLKLALVYMGGSTSKEKPKCGLELLKANVKALKLNPTSATDATYTNALPQCVKEKLTIGTSRTDLKRIQLNKTLSL